MPAWINVDIRMPCPSDSTTKLPRRAARHLSRSIHSDEAGLTFGERFATTCNTSPTDGNKY